MWLPKMVDIVMADSLKNTFRPFEMGTSKGQDFVYIKFSNSELVFARKVFLTENNVATENGSGWPIVILRNGNIKG